jgi:hypothetical protein
LFAHLDGLGSAPVPSTESEWLDCKGAARISDADVQKYWSKTLAAFGTTQGGVLIWGLDCRKQGDPPVDCVTGPSYVATPAALKSRLMELHHLATDPPIQGVEVEAVLDPVDTSRGFVVCFVPENSEYVPQRVRRFLDPDAIWQPVRAAVLQTEYWKPRFLPEYLTRFRLAFPPESMAYAHLKTV